MASLHGVFEVSLHGWCVCWGHDAVEGFEVFIEFIEQAVEGIDDFPIPVVDLDSPFIDKGVEFDGGILLHDGYPFYLLERDVVVVVVVVVVVG